MDNYAKSSLKNLNALFEWLQPHFDNPFSSTLRHQHNKENPWCRCDRCAADVDQAVEEHQEDHNSCDSDHCSHSVTPDV